MLLSEAVRLFVAFRSGEGLSPRSLVWYRLQLDAFLAWLGDKPLAALSAVDVALFLSRESERGLKPSSVEARYRALQAWLNWCEMQGYGASVIGHGAQKRVRRPKRGAPVVDYVRFEEYRAVVDAMDLATWLDDRDYCLVGMLYWSGLRRSELCGLGVQDVDLRRHVVAVRSGKGGRGRLVPLDESVTAGLIAYLDHRPGWPGPELWLALDHQRRGVRGGLRIAGLREMLRRRCKAAGVRYLRPHLWRHGFGMGLLGGGAEMSAVSAMMGHSSTRVTESVYARHLIDGLQRQHRDAAARIKEQRR